MPVNVTKRAPSSHMPGVAGTCCRNRVTLRLQELEELKQLEELQNSLKNSD